MEDDMKGKKINFKISDNLQRGVSASLLLLPGILVVLPVVLLVTGSVMDQYELAELLKPIFREKGIKYDFSYSLPNTGPVLSSSVRIDIKGRDS